MELLVGIGFAAKELFDYNREIYQFDQGQRLERELLRLEMQVKRFELFREDVRDLVQLTVGKMEMYHVVGALVLEISVLFYTNGRVRAMAPAYICGLYWLSAAGSFIYVLLAVWLSMHASIASHSFGVRLLTRFVRLPIPSTNQFNSLNARLTDFERQKAAHMLRLPGMGTAPHWATRNGGNTEDMLGQGVEGFGEVETLNRAAVFLPGKHIQLFRRLQAKWQCYDAYARVCMSLGATQILLTLSYYLICLTLIEYDSPSTCFALITVFQCTALALFWLDVAGLKRRTLFALQFLGSAPCYIAGVGVIISRYENGGGSGAPSTPLIVRFDSSTKMFTWITFFLSAAWLEGLLHCAWPSNDIATLPRRFRTVLFLDVFCLADDAEKKEHMKPGKAEIQASPQRHDVVITPEQAAAADEALFLAEAALRRWEAVPSGTEEAAAFEAHLQVLRRNLTIWRKALNAEAARRAERRGDQDAIALLEPDKRRWDELDEQEQEDDPWAGKLLGPFHNGKQDYYYDLEGRQFVWQAEESDALTLEQVAALVVEGERHVRTVLGGESTDDFEPALPSDETGSETSKEDENASATSPPHKYLQQLHTVQRLPWRVLQSMTRVLELAWLGVGLSQLLQDFLAVKEYDLNPTRRLQSTAPLDLPSWNFDALPSEVWPRGAFFSPSAISCTGPSVLLVGSNGLHWTAYGERPPAALDLENYEGGSQPSAFCADQAGSRCFLASLAPSQSALLLWEPRSRATQNFTLTRPWHLFSGAAVECAKIAWHPNVRSEWCVLLAGWDGQTLPLVVLPVELGSLPQQPFSPSFDIDVEAFSLGQEPVAIHLEQGGLLWAWHADGSITLWDVLKLRRLRQWRPLQQQSWKPLSFCIRNRTISPEMLVLGQDSQAGLQLLRASVPVSLS